MNLDSYKDKSALIREEAQRLGFDGCGISRAERLTGDELYLAEWLNNNYHAGMAYMARNADKRCDPTLLVEKSRSVISVIMNYSPEKSQPAGHPRISKYAYGNDYHEILKSRLYKLSGFINLRFGKAESRIFTDTAPVLERAWAARGGLGWIGKNTCLVTKKHGSWVFIGELVTGIELEYDQPVKNHCGTCTKCIDACPVKAIVSPNVIDSNRCISYHTIENNKEIPGFLKGKMNHYYFGCDICQDVCPWNSRPVPATDVKMQFRNPFFSLQPDKLAGIDEEEFQSLAKGTCLRRSGYKGINRNLKFLTEAKI